MASLHPTQCVMDEINLTRIEISVGASPEKVIRLLNASADSPDRDQYPILILPGPSQA